MVKGAAFGLTLAVVPRPMRRWMLTMLVLVIAALATLQHTPEVNAWEPGVTAAEWDAYQNGPDGFMGTGYLIPWYCAALIVAVVVWGIFGYIRALYLCHIYRAQQRAAGQTFTQRVRTATNKRVLIAVDGTPRPPQSPTGPSAGTTAPPPPAPAAPPTPPSPMGSTLPKLWVPTYSGPAQPVQRVETSLGGTLIHDHRRVDPDEL